MNVIQLTSVPGPTRPPLQGSNHGSSCMLKGVCREIFQSFLVYLHYIRHEQKPQLIQNFPEVPTVLFESFNYYIGYKPSFIGRWVSSDVNVGVKQNGRTLQSTTSDLPVGLQLISVTSDQIDGYKGQGQTRRRSAPLVETSHPGTCCRKGDGARYICQD